MTQAQIVLYPLLHEIYTLHQQRVIIQVLKLLN